MNGMTLYAVFLTVPLTAVLGFGIPPQNVQIGTFKKKCIREQNVFRCMFGKSMLIEKEELDDEADHLANALMGKYDYPSQKPVDKKHGFNIKLLSGSDFGDNSDDIVKKILKDWEPDVTLLHAYADGLLPIDMYFGHLAQILMDDVKEAGCAVMLDAEIEKIAFVANYNTKVDLNHIDLPSLMKTKSECERIVDPAD